MGGDRCARRWVVGLLATLLLACPAGSPPSTAPEPPRPPRAEGAEPVPPGEATGFGAEPLEAGQRCWSGDQCPSGVCEGQGCDEGQCAPVQRVCTRDLRAYCGCDGQTFRASGSCPGRLYAHPGECP